MFCPNCGAAMSLADRSAELKKAQEEHGKRVVRWGGLPGDNDEAFPEFEWDEAEHYECSSMTCPYQGLPLIRHHPFKGLKSKPAGSWSLTWIN